MSEDRDKEFDAVATTREIRDRLSARIKDMTADEQREWMRLEVSSDPKLKRLMERTSADAPSR